MQQTVDVIVIGAGHAGCEAAAAAARLGAKVILITLRQAGIGQLSCNPAIGGVGKSHLVKEIDALGGLMAQVTDAVGLQFRTLNASRGPAVRATRVQVDAVSYQQVMRRTLAEIAGLMVLEDEVVDLLIEKKCCVGVITKKGSCLRAAAVICTTGTFLQGRCFRGQTTWPGGRWGDLPANYLSKALKRAGLTLGRFKTGTTPRLHRDSIDWSQLQIQQGETPAPMMAFDGLEPVLPQQPCFLTYTDKTTHALIAAELHQSPLYRGEIVGRGPRYCPAIEDKVVRFADKDRHAVFLEPESLTNPQIYANGLATSLPEAVQDAFLKTIPGLKQVHVLRYGYAVEYDYVPPQQLHPSLMTQALPGLFLAGQINGTSGYEEAAAQGLWAGLNGARFAAGDPAVTLRRDQAYLAVLVDDLVRHGVNEPYRMFPARAEYRLTLRETNAEDRLTHLGQQWGLVPAARAAAAKKRADERHRLRQLLFGSAHQQTALHFGGRNGEPLAQILRRPEVSVAAVVARLEKGIFSAAAMTAVEEEIKYAGYIAREQRDIAQLQHLAEIQLQPSLDYQHVPGLSWELREKLQHLRPLSLLQASQIPGMTPAALTLLRATAQRLPQQRA